ncbi:unnamed protein product [Polarella glacialis]|uniref:Uncharacterized protein n=1 Tax=Polarella glacialis TaxID=89957 RepID=A0A813FH00_POLGL|nr:unnamed protein product [Polarella glacialis]
MTAAHAGYALESAVVPGDLDSVWDLLKPMTFKFNTKVSQAKRENGEEEGSLGQFSIAYTDNTVQTLRVVEISERLPNKRSIGMELVCSDPPVSYSSRMDQIVVSAVTHSDVPSVFIEFSSDFSTDATLEAIEDSKYKKRDFFNDLRSFLGPPGSAPSKA